MTQYFAFSGMAIYSHSMINLQTVLLVLFFCLSGVMGISANRVHAADEYVSAKSIRANAKRIDLFLRSSSALVFDERENEVILRRNADKIMPVASLSKLMTAMVILDADLDMDQEITISSKDKDRIRYSRSRLTAGMKFTRKDLLLIALAASENRASMALGRTFPGGMQEFVQQMNLKAKQLELHNTHFADPAGLRNENVSTAEELMKMVQAAARYPVIREFTTNGRDSITNLQRGREVQFINTNRLVNRKSWSIQLSKTGFTSEAGNCLVMQTQIKDRPVIIVLLESWGKLSKYGDSNRIKKWLYKVERLARKQS